MRTKTERANKATIGTVNEKTRKNSSTWITDQEIEVIETKKVATLRDVKILAKIWRNIRNWKIKAMGDVKGKKKNASNVNIIAWDEVFRNEERNVKEKGKSSWRESILEKSSSLHPCTNLL
jgi:hypothetical protein